MRRFITLTLVALLLALMTQTAQAGWRDFWFRVHVDRHRNNAWPEPFQTMDRQSVAAAFAPMSAAGWQVQNTMTEHDFDANTGQLTRAGASKLRWIATQAPPQRRTVFVLRGDSEDQTAWRIDTVQQMLTRFVPDGPLPEVVRTNDAPHGANGGQTYDVWTKFQQVQPQPKLPEAAGLGGGTQ